MIGGNLYVTLQVKTRGKKNSIGAAEYDWMDCTSLHGYLDLSGGDSKRTPFNAKIQESTHIFLCDFVSLKELSAEWVWDPFNFLTGVIRKGTEETVDATSENARMVVAGEVYEILLIDDPMHMHEHLEIYLRYIGGQ